MSLNDPNARAILRLCGVASCVLATDINLGSITSCQLDFLKQTYTVTVLQAAQLC